MKKSLFILGIAFIISLGSEQLSAQGASTAVMDVRVEVVNGATISRNDSVATISLSDSSNEKISYGDFSIFVPDGAEVLTSSDVSIEMINSDQSVWVMGSEVETVVEENGVINLKFTTSNQQQEIQKGSYRGMQHATIEYL
ncbi:MAG: hypothetical protein WD735_02490 [Balneolaceae bacterium]